MNDTTAARLLQLNVDFYQAFAHPFSDTRQRLQPGVRQILNLIDPDARILDLGCGNGELAWELALRGFSGRYVGLDFSENLLQKARSKIEEWEDREVRNRFLFSEADFSRSNWHSVLADFKPSLVLAFAALHHLPGQDTRRQILKDVRSILSEGGNFIHSNWQFLNSQRLRERIHPWSEIGLSDADVDPGDYLLDWRRGGFGLRYVHHFSEIELNSLAAETGFQLLETFYSDGENGNLGLYQVWKITS